jgi:hypothetical protein
MLAAPILLFAVVAAVACSKPPSNGNGIASANGTAASASPSAVSDTEALMSFAKCMREHGVNMPDPDPDVEFPPRDLMRSPGSRAAKQACEHLMPGEGGVTAPDAQQLEQLRSYAVCMRAHGVEMSDPLPNGNMTISGRLEGFTRPQLDNDPGYKAATEACKDKLPAEGEKKLGGGK